MFNLSEEISVKQLTKYLGSATVLSYDEEEKTTVLQIKNDEGEYNTFGKVAIPNCPVLMPGDNVLAAGNDINSLYIIGLLNHRESENNKTEKVTLNNKKLQVLTENGELIFEYDPEKRINRVNIQSGDLELITNEGNINFVSGKNIHFKSNHSIIMESVHDVQINVASTNDKTASKFSLNNKKIKMSSPELNIISQRTRIQTEDMNYTGNKFSATIRQGKIRAGKLETIANDIICKTKNLFYNADELFQISAGRMRSLIKSTLHIKAKNSYLKSEKDFKINGEKIHLG